MRIRHLKVDFSAPVTQGVRGNLFVTHLLNALSTTFPAGEDYFKRSVKAVVGATKREDIKIFMSQESFHTKVHLDYNRNLANQGYPTEEMGMVIERALELARKRLSDKVNLSFTCALEHITALLAEVILTSPDLVERMSDPRLEEMWVWHAIEELEHKAVAFDVYQGAFGDYPVRVMGLVIATAALAFITTVYMFVLLDIDRRNSKWVWAKGLKDLFLSPGYVSRVIPAWFRYFDPKFHPNQNDASKLIEAFDNY